MINAGGPGGVNEQVILEPGIIRGQSREFESPRVHTHTRNSWGLFLEHNLTYLRKTRERELATTVNSR